MRIEPNLLFYTPQDKEDLLSWIEAHCAEESSVAMVAAMMAWNLACKISKMPELNGDQDEI